MIISQIERQVTRDVNECLVSTLPSSRQRSKLSMGFKDRRTSVGTPRCFLVCGSARKELAEQITQNILIFFRDPDMTAQEPVAVASNQSN